MSDIKVPTIGIFN